MIKNFSIGKYTLSIKISLFKQPDWYKECTDSIKDGMILRAVKIYKDNTEKNLINSRDEVFAVRDYYEKTGKFLSLNKIKNYTTYKNI